MDCAPPPFPAIKSVSPKGPLTFTVLWRDCQYHGLGFRPPPPPPTALM